MPQKVWDLQKEALRQIGKCAQEYSVLACLENMIGVREFLCRSPEELIGMTEGIEGIGMTFDFGHANTVGELGNFLNHISQANHIHIHDNNGLSDEHLALGDGNIPWISAGKTITKDYQGIVVIEGKSISEAMKSLAVYRRCFI
jgi:sugar phosphate isomerase/epimerase